MTIDSVTSLHSMDTHVEYGVNVVSDGVFVDPWLSEVADDIVHGADDLVEFVGSDDAVAVDVVQLERPLQFDRSVQPLLHGLRLTAGTSTPVRSIGSAAFARLTVDSWNVHSSSIDRFRRFCTAYG